MIHISESYPGERTVVITVQGTLNSESLPVFEETYSGHAGIGRRISIDLGSITTVDRDGREFLKKIRDGVEFVGMPAYLELLIGP